MGMVEIPQMARRPCHRRIASVARLCQECQAEWCRKAGPLHLATLAEVDRSTSNSPGKVYKYDKIAPFSPPSSLENIVRVGEH